VSNGEPSTISKKTVQGAAWTMGTSLGVRAMQVVGTLALTHYLEPREIGEVNNAAILLISAMRFSQVGVPQYLVTRTRHRRDVAWHATILLVATSAVAIGGVTLLGKPLSVALKAPGMNQYLPWLAGAVFLMAVGVIPDRLMRRELRFKEASLIRTGSELSYTVGSVVAAAVGIGPMAIVIGNVLRSSLFLVATTAKVPPREWMTPHPLSRATMAEMMAYGLPFMVATIMTVASQTWDNLMMSALYGPAVAGAYALAYNLADIPATQVGEQISDVLTPSLVHLSPDDRRNMLVRSTAMLSLIVFPLAVGLGAVAETLVSTLLRNAWSMVAPMLSILAFLSVVRPIGWTIGSYLSVQGRTKTIMWLSLVNVVVLFSSMAMLGHWFGPLAACYGVGIGFSVHALGSVWVVRQSEGIPLSAFLRATVPPLVASAALAAAVFATRRWLIPHLPELRGIALFAELLAGGIAYVVSISVISPKMLVELLHLVRLARRTRT